MVLATIDNVIEKKLTPMTKKAVDCIRPLHLVREGITKRNVDVVVIEFEKVLQPKLIVCVVMHLGRERIGQILVRNAGILPKCPRRIC